jgi:branched-chain amino acid aminotransferase
MKMHELASFNGEIIPAASASIDAVSSAALYGRGVFTTIAIREREPFLWEKHWRRLVNDAGKLNVDLSGYGEDMVAGALTDLIARNIAERGRSRVTFFDGSGGGMWNTRVACGTGLLIVTGDPKPVPESFRLTISPYPLNSRSPLAGIKSCNYLENLLALEEAKGRGFDEAVRLNERGEIASACMANIFWRKDGQLFTPPLSSGCLAGTVRGYVIEKHGAIETEGKIDDVLYADNVYLTSSGIGIMPVKAIDSREFAVNRLSPEF